VNKFEGKLKMYKHLEDIRNKLWSEDGKSRVSVMVGAGFSLNAEKLDESLESMSLWSDLKSKIAEELKHINISEETDVLSLAQIYEEEYGRTNLDELIKQAIPDQNYEPGELHRSLLRLPWADVYTTNYDTLLERTLPYVYERSYQVIYDINDIPSSVSPRIIKLHGSFPSKRPFIFTKKDYDTYEQKFTPFVNMVQQSIMETTFVLIGFSGNDPNFEKWTKWVRDNLGEHMPKIYMLAYNEQKNESLLRERNITLIDFKDVYKETENKDVYKEMFKDIFDFLSYKDRKDKKEWPYKPFPYSSSNLDKVLQTFKYNRESYPGWLIVPDIIKKKNKGNIELSKDNILRHIRDEDDISIKISIIYELVWVYEKFQIPLDFHFHNFLKKFVDEILKDEVLLSKINVNLFAFIVLRLVKEARLDFNEDEYIKYTKSLKKIRLTNEQQNQLIYEEIQFKLSNFDFEEVRNKVNKWKLSKKDLDWSLKKAIILLKIGEKQRAIEELEETLERVRQLITISRNNYHLLSLEGLILVNLIQLNHHYSLTNSKDRLNYLESKLCNPLKELDFMYSRIKPFAKKSGVFVKKGFDPNKIKRTYSFSNFFESEVIDSYSILMISEEWGMYLTNSQTINEAIKNLEIIYPFYSWVKFIQVGNLENIDDFFSRETIYKSNASSLSNLFKIIFNGIKNKENTKVELLLEILSRLYFALTKDEKKKADNLILELYKDRDLYKVNIYSIIKVLASLFQRIIFDKDQNERAEFFSKVLELPIIGDPHGELKDIDLDENYFFDPSYKFEFDLDDAEGIYIEFNQKEIDRLLKILDGEKSNIRDAVKADYFFPKIAGLKFPRRTSWILLFFFLEPLFP
jgi:SIR2-like domain